MDKHFATKFDKMYESLSLFGKWLPALKPYLIVSKLHYTINHYNVTEGIY